jgi:hypothetical protein
LIYTTGAIMAEILNYGGGIQTVAMCLLVEQGKLPRPDYIVMADTGREMPTTFEYLDQYIQPRMQAIGLEVIIAGHDLATVDLYDSHGLTLMPVFTSTGKLSTYCSGEWKKRVIQRKLRSLGISSARSWIGFSVDERKRMMKPEAGPWQVRYPLIELGLTRANCVQVIEDAGLPLPTKSRCYMCPHQTDQEWREVQQSPELWRRALAIDSEIRDNDDRGGVYLHSSRQPLAEVTLDPDDDKPHGRQCQLGMCFI